MPSTHRPIPHFVQGGVNQSQARHLVPEGSFWEMINLRPSAGRLVQTPWLVEHFNLTLLNTETVPSQVRLLKLVRNANNEYRYLIINHSNARYVDPVIPATQVLIPTVRQTHVPSGTTEYKQCLLWGISALDFAATGTYFEVQIITGQFQWRKDDGVWNGPLAIGPEVSIGVGLKVGFVGATPASFTNGDTWRWTRTDKHQYTGADSTTFNFPWPSMVYNTDIYIAGLERQIMRIRDGVMTSVGYKPVYGKYVAVLANHLVVAHFAEGVYDAVFGQKDSYDAKTTPFTLGWSHRENPDLMYATSLNEADQYSIPEQGQFDQAPMGVTGMAPWGGRLLIYMADSVHVMTYVGLPTVMQTELANPMAGNQFQAGLVVTPRGHYFIGREDIWLFNGQFQKIGANVTQKLFSEMAPLGDFHRQQLHGYYDPDNGTVTWTYWIKVATNVYQVRQLVYEEDTNVWYFRNLPSAATGYGDVFAQCTKFLDKGVSVYAGLGSIYRDANGDSSGFLEDLITGGTPEFTEPALETGFSNYGNWFAVKESSGLFLDADYNSGAGVEVFFDFRDLVGDGIPVFRQVEQIWKKNLTEARLSLPNVSGRQMAYKMVFKHGNVPVYNAVFNGWQEFIYGVGAEA